jgi:hypothetical protein
MEVDQGLQFRKKETNAEKLRPDFLVAGSLSVSFRHFCSSSFDAFRIERAISLLL